MTKTMRVRSGCALLLLAPLFGGCLITTNSDDTNDTSPSDTSGDGGTSLSSFSATITDGGSSGVADESGGSEGETTAGPTGDCSDTKIVDGGFEAGTPSGMIRNGYSPDVIPNGAEVTITGFRGRDEKENIGMLRQLTLADGKVFGLFGPQEGPTAR